MWQTFKLIGKIVAGIGALFMVLIYFDNFGFLGGMIILIAAGIVLFVAGLVLQLSTGNEREKEQAGEMLTKVLVTVSGPIALFIVVTIAKEFIK